MSLYREASGPRMRTAIVIVVTALAAGIGGYLIGRATAPEPTLTEQIADARASAEPALKSLELVDIEYPQAFEESETGGPTELQAALDHAEAAIETLDDAEDLTALDPNGVGEAHGAAEAVAIAIKRRASITEVRDLVGHARRTIEKLIGIRDQLAAGEE